MLLTITDYAWSIQVTPEAVYYMTNYGGLPFVIDAGVKKIETTDPVVIVYSQAHELNYYY